MTREEAIAYFKRHIDLYCVTGICREAEEMAIQALEQEPCEDTISRQNDILPNIDKEVESYKKVIKNPVVKSIMGMDEEQEQIEKKYAEPQEISERNLKMWKDIYEEGKRRMERSDKG